MMRNGKKRASLKDFLVMIKIIDLDDEGLAEAKSFFVKFFK